MDKLEEEKTKEEDEVKEEKKEEEKEKRKAAICSKVSPSGSRSPFEQLTPIIRNSTLPTSYPSSSSSSSP